MNMKLSNSNKGMELTSIIKRVMMLVMVLVSGAPLNIWAQQKQFCDSSTIRKIQKNYRSHVRECREELKSIYPRNSHYSRELYSTILKAQKEVFKRQRDSLFIETTEREYLNNITKYRSSWSKLIPSYSKLQLAGGIGTVAIGPGWDYGRKEQWETDFLIGYLPKYESQEWKITLTLKQNYIPWSIKLGKSSFQFSPLTCGIYGCIILGGDFWLKEPLRYPDRSYYRFPTRLRGHIFLGERFTLNIKPGMSRAHKSISFYYEICTHDLALMSIFTNKYLTIKDAASLAFGLKFQIF